MPAPEPTHTSAALPPPNLIRAPLVKKYGYENVIWPQIVSIRSSSETIAYIYDRNRWNRTNNRNDNRPTGKSGVPQHFLDYDQKERKLDPGTPRKFQQMIDLRFGRLHQFMSSRRPKHPYTAVDIDIVWFDGTNWKGLELSGYENLFEDRPKTEKLVRTTSSRPTWRGPNGAIALKKMIKAAQDLDIELHMAFLNTQGRNTGIYRYDSNAYSFKLTPEQVLLLEEGQTPQNAQFGPVSDFINSL